MVYKEIEANARGGRTKHHQARRRCSFHLHDTFALSGVRTNMLLNILRVHRSYSLSACLSMFSLTIDQCRSRCRRGCKDTEVSWARCRCCSCTEAFILQRYTIVNLSVKFVGKRAIENPAQREAETWDRLRDVDVSRAIERINESKSRQPHAFP